MEATANKVCPVETWDGRFKQIKCAIFKQLQERTGLPLRRIGELVAQEPKRWFRRRNYIIEMDITLTPTGNPNRPSLTGIDLWYLASRPDIKQAVYDTARWCTVEFKTFVGVSSSPGPFGVPVSMPCY